MFSPLGPPGQALGLETIYEGYLVALRSVSALLARRSRRGAPPRRLPLRARPRPCRRDRGTSRRWSDLAELISLCAQSRADGRDGDGPAWAATAAVLGRGGLGSPAAHCASRAMRASWMPPPASLRATTPSTAPLVHMPDSSGRSSPRCSPSSSSSSPVGREVGVRGGPRHRPRDARRRRDLRGLRRRRAILELALTKRLTRVTRLPSRVTHGSAFAYLALTPCADAAARPPRMDRAPRAGGRAPTQSRSRPTPTSRSPRSPIAS